MNSYDQNVTIALKGISKNPYTNVQEYGMGISKNPYTNVQEYGIIET